MLIKQIQFTKCTEEELDLIPDFLNWVIDNIYANLNTKINRRKIQLRLNHLLEVPWIQWKKKDVLDVSTIMKCIYDSFTYEEGKNNLWILTTNANVIIPNTFTSIDRVIRFIEYGDMKYHATGMFNQISNSLDYHKINTMWRMFLLNRNNTGISESRLLVS